LDKSADEKQVEIWNENEQANDKGTNVGD